jgi:hypothetical protein
MGLPPRPRVTPGREKGRACGGTQSEQLFPTMRLDNVGMPSLIFPVSMFRPIINCTRMC